MLSLPLLTFLVCKLDVSASRLLIRQGRERVEWTGDRWDDGRGDRKGDKWKDGRGDM